MELKDLIFLAAAKIYASLPNAGRTKADNRKAAIEAAKALWEDVCEADI